MSRYTAKLLVRTLVGGVLIVGFYLLWCGLTVSKALNEGALAERPALCLDRKHLRFEQANTTPDRIVDITLERQILSHEGISSNSVSHLIKAVSVQLGWWLFWSRSERRRLYDELRVRLKSCPGIALRPSLPSP
ncbi:hypothetical protein [Sphingomonas sp. SUN039]|uniref:hypothetical protein n=1 Tax=Sphingomonas sp. SUN039 TaxID=2937787 RepID=UPI002164B10A|nr:hypothetical protein [Sphingomonas sp. SUN039]UVO54172.1 hypothetical protein M0209_08570 [Sphingomonas sp. SUN039]